MDKSKIDELIVGQSKIKEMLLTWYSQQNFPHFIILSGERGSGKKHIAKVIGKMLDCDISIAEDVKADTIKNIVDSSYFVKSPILYIIPDADNMSNSSKNSLLKLTEEPPSNAYIIMTVTSLENTLPTLLSRSQSLQISSYSREDLAKFTDSDIILNISSNPGMVKQLEDMGNDKVEELLSYCNKVICSLYRVSTSNALKSSSSLKFKATDSGYDLDIYFSALRYCLGNLVLSNSLDVKVASAYYRSLASFQYRFQRSGVNKKALYDMFILDLRSRVGGLSNGSA